MADPDLQIRVADNLDPGIRKGAVSKKIFVALRASVWSTNKGGDLGPSPGSATDVNILSLLNELILNSRRSTGADYLQ